MVRNVVRARSERGAAVVEFALVSTLLITLVVGIMSYGYMLSFRQGISQGAAEGARAAAVAPATFSAAQKQTAAQNAVNQALDSYGVQCDGTNLVRNGSSVGSCSVTIGTCANNTAKQCASVLLDYGYRANPLIPSFPGLGVTLPSNLRYTSVAEVS
ncbi:MAG TPA: TadE family protein [Nocardioidaceae bacterium]|nr:TadE family protein [Nocardioidaceae bacterium]